MVWVEFATIHISINHYMKGDVWILSEWGGHYAEGPGTVQKVQGLCANLSYIIQRGSSLRSLPPCM